MRKLFQLSILVVVMGFAGGQDNAQAYEWTHIVPDRCTTLATIENPIECRDRIGDDEGSEGTDRRAIQRGRERQRNAMSDADRTWRRWQHKQCAQDHTLYVLRHPFVKPAALAELSGCRLYAADAAYHSSIKSGGLLTSLIFQFAA